ncbi:MAG: hypothetical protein NDI82_12250, partial [Anaeromyxobacteraceae bacterium]|nr:hypothetical protein [Anaeromyxobacteraceae bacterium]
MTTRTLPSPGAAATLLALALAAAGCSETFTPPSVVEDRRILTLVADPPALDGTDPSAATTVRAVEAQPISPPPLPAGTDALVRRWTFCPFTLGAAAGYACAVPACEVPLAADAAGAVTVRPVEEAEACLAALGANAPPDLVGGLPPAVEVLLRYRLVAVATAAPGAGEVVLREAVQRVPVWILPPPAPPNALPAFAAAAVTIGSGLDAVVAQPCPTPEGAGVLACPVAGTLPAGGQVRVVAAVDAGTIEDYPAGGRTATETFAITFFT